MKGDAFELLDNDLGTPPDAETVAEAGLRELYEKQREIDMLARVAGSANASSSTSEAALSLLKAVCDFGPFDCGLALVPADAASGDGHASSATTPCSAGTTSFSTRSSGPSTTSRRPSPNWWPGSTMSGSTGHSSMHHHARSRRKRPQTASES